MSGSEAKLTTKQERGLAALLCSPSLAEAAKVCAVSEFTLRRWLAQPDFQRAYRDARRGALQAAVARLQAISGGAVETLQSALSAPRPQDQIRAAVAILDHAFSGTQLLDVVERVQSIEQQLETLENRPVG